MNSNISFIAGHGPLPIFTGATPHSEKFTFNLPHSTEIRKFSLLIANIFQFPAHPFLLCNNIVTYPKTFSREKRAKFCIFFTHISHQIYATLKPVLTLPRSRGQLLQLLHIRSKHIQRLFHRLRLRHIDAADLQKVNRIHRAAAA